MRVRQRESRTRNTLEPGSSPGGSTFDNESGDLVSECTLWPGALEKTGYGRLKRNGKMWMAHRWAFVQANGPIPEGLTVDHLCFNRACVNPEHLRLVTRAENAVRHQDGCDCPVCARSGRPTDVCPRGHVKAESGVTKSGCCLPCQRKAKRDYMRRVRSA